MSKLGFFLLFLISLLIASVTSIRSQDDKIYIVYMGGKGTKIRGSLRNNQAKLLDSFIKRNAVVHVYKHGFKGFAVRMSEDEALLEAHAPGVVSVFPERRLKLHTTRSWSFLKHQNHLANSTSATSFRSSSFKGADIVTGVIDTCEYMTTLVEYTSLPPHFTLPPESTHRHNYISSSPPHDVPAQHS